jgi:hypothetical protein
LIASQKDIEKNKELTPVSIRENRKAIGKFSGRNEKNCENDKVEEEVSKLHFSVNLVKYLGRRGDDGAMPSSHMTSNSTEIVAIFLPCN